MIRVLTVGERCGLVETPLPLIGAIVEADVDGARQLAAHLYDDVLVVRPGHEERTADAIAAWLEGDAWADTPGAAAIAHAIRGGGWR